MADPKCKSCGGPAHPIHMCPNAIDLIGPGSRPLVVRRASPAPKLPQTLLGDPTAYKRAKKLGGSSILTTANDNIPSRGFHKDMEKLAGLIWGKSLHGRTRMEALGHVVWSKDVEMQLCREGELHKDVAHDAVRLACQMLENNDVIIIRSLGGDDTFTFQLTSKGSVASRVENEAKSAR